MSNLLHATRKHDIVNIVAKKRAQSLSLEPVYQLWAWVLLLWSLYRHFFTFPEWADELIFKPLVFVIPVIWYVVNKEKRKLNTLGLSLKNLFPSIYLGLGIGFVFAIEGLAANALKHGTLVSNPLPVFLEYGFVLFFALSIATAFSEELLTRGFIFTRILEKKDNLIYAAVVSSILFVLLHVPILVTSVKLTGPTLLLFFITDFVLGFANAVLFARTKTLVAPILVHVFWNMTVALYL